MLNLFTVYYRQIEIQPIVMMIQDAWMITTQMVLALLQNLHLAVAF